MIAHPNRSIIQPQPFHASPLISLHPLPFLPKLLPSSNNKSSRSKKVKDEDYELTERTFSVAEERVVEGGGGEGVEEEEGETD